MYRGGWTSSLPENEFQDKNVKLITNLDQEPMQPTTGHKKGRTHSSIIDLRTNANRVTRHKRTVTAHAPPAPQVNLLMQNSRGAAIGEEDLVTIDVHGEPARDQAIVNLLKDGDMEIDHMGSASTATRKKTATG